MIPGKTEFGDKIYRAPMIKEPREKMFKRGDVVRVTENVKKLVETQWLPEEIAQEIAGKEFVVSWSYRDKSYDLEGTRAKLDNSVLEYVGHPPRKPGRKGCTHVYNLVKPDKCVICGKKPKK